MAFEPTEAQKKIYEFVENGSGNGIIDAVAGAGKTTTLMGCIQHVPNPYDTLFCAFNRSIRKEIQHKFQQMGKNVAVKTNHALGLQILRGKMQVDLNDDKYKLILHDKGFFKLIEHEVDAILGYQHVMSLSKIREIEEKRASVDDASIIHLFNFSKEVLNYVIGLLLEINDKYRLTLCEDTPEAYWQMGDHFGIFDSNKTYHYHREELEHFFRAHQTILKEGNEMAKSQGIIDYVDMLYLPHFLDLYPLIHYGFIFVDECQDLSRAQIEIVSKYLKPSGRVLAVGDPYQSIYGFAGADSDSFDRVKNLFNCQLLLLSDCFRCPVDVITIAQKIREDIKGFKTEAGVVVRLKKNQVLSRLIPGDLVISRRKEPLYEIAMKLVNNNVKVHLHPDEVDEMIGDYKSYFTPKELRMKLTDDMIEDFLGKIEHRNISRIEKECANLDSAIRSVRIKEAVNMLRGSLDFFLDKYIDWQLNTINSILVRLKETLRYLGDDAIRISSIHRAKGLENDRVFILEYNKLPMGAIRPWQQIQERNLHYVAVTRPRKELYLCLEETEVDEIDEKIENTTGNTFVEAKAPVAESAKPELRLKHERNYNFIKILPITAIQKIPAKFYQFGEIDDTPFDGLNKQPFQKAKYWAIYEALQNTEYEIENIICTNYLDSYVLNSPLGTKIYDGHYKASGVYHFTPREQYQDHEVIMPYLNDESNYSIQFEYKPQNEGFEAAHCIITAACKDLGILNTNIFKEGYNMVYCLKTVSSYAYMKLTFNKAGVITTLMPFSTGGKDDTALVSLLEIVSHLWQD